MSGYDKGENDNINFSEIMLSFLDSLDDDKVFNKSKHPNTNSQVPLKAVKSSDFLDFEDDLLELEEDKDDCIISESHVINENLFLENNYGLVMVNNEIMNETESTNTIKNQQDCPPTRIIPNNEFIPPTKQKNANTRENQQDCPPTRIIPNNEFIPPTKQKNFVEDILNSLKNIEIDDNDDDVVIDVIYRMTHLEEDNALIDNNKECSEYFTPAKYTNVKISKYILGNCIADGGQAQIYEVKNDPHKVCKIFKENMMRAEREMDVLLMLKELRHPGIIEIQDICELEQQKCFFMRKIAGSTLAETKIKKDLLSCLLLMWRIAETIAIVHSRGISHRDLKPENIMLDRYQFPTIIDFGLTKHDAHTGNKTQSLLGTPRYMAPEQFLGKHLLGEQIDVHALGVIFYEILTEKWPFGGLEEYNMISVATPIVKEVIDDIPAIFKIPKNLKKICLRCLDKDTEKRYINAVPLASELWQELCRLLYAEFNLATNKEGCLKIAEQIFDPYWLGRNKSLKYWKKLFFDFFHCDVEITYLPKEYQTIKIGQQINPYKILKKEINRYPDQLFKAMHISEGHQAIFQQRLGNSFMKTLTDDNLIHPGGSIHLSKEELLDIQKAFLDAFYVAIELGFYLCLSFESIEYDEKIRFSLQGTPPTQDEITYFLENIFTGRLELELWQKKINEGKKKWWQNLFNSESEKSPWDLFCAIIKKEFGEKTEKASIKVEESKLKEKSLVVKNSSSSRKYPGFTYLSTQNYLCNNRKIAIEKYLHEATQLIFSKLPKGSFLMGSNLHSIEKPVHKVNIHSFLVSQTIVTQKTWMQIMKTQPWKGGKYIKGGDQYPATYVNWLDVQDFCEKTGLQLLSESQWEYACRGTSTSDYYWGNNFNDADNYIWYVKNTTNINNGFPHEVSLKFPNGFGLYDMIGNVWEWCADEWHNNYNNAPVDGSVWENNSSNKNVSRVRRGAGFWYGENYCRCSFREKIDMNIRHGGLGFRVCYNPLETN